MGIETCGGHAGGDEVGGDEVGGDDAGGDEAGGDEAGGALGRLHLVMLSVLAKVPHAAFFGFAHKVTCGS